MARAKNCILPVRFMVCAKTFFWSMPNNIGKYAKITSANEKWSARNEIIYLFAARNAYVPEQKTLQQTIFHLAGEKSLPTMLTSISAVKQFMSTILPKHFRFLVNPFGEGKMNSQTKFVKGRHWKMDEQRFLHTWKCKYHSMKIYFFFLTNKKDMFKT